MNFDFDTPTNRRDSESVKWRKYPADVLPMWVADMDFRAPPAVLEALRERLAHGVFGYPVEREAVKQAVADWMARRHGWQVDPATVILLPGVVPAFNVAARAFARPGEGMLIQTPVYGPFLRVAQNAGLLHQEMELTQTSGGGYTVDFDAFEAAITAETRLFLLCNPHNPVGHVFQRDELEGMAEICLRHNVVICSDEIHSDLVFRGYKHTPVAALSPEIAANTVTLVAPSKTFNLAGLKASAAIIENPELREKFETARADMVEWVNVLGQTAMLAAYQEGEPWLEALLEYLQVNRDLVFNFVKDELPSVRMAKPEGTHLAWLDCRQAGIAGNASAFFLKEARVAVNDGAWFGTGGEGFVRFNFAAPRALVLEALERMKAALMQDKTAGRD